MNSFLLDDFLSIESIESILRSDSEVELPSHRKDLVIRCREYLDEKIKSTNKPIYGINTGFGSLYNRDISSDNLSKLQENLVKSHACGTGAEVDQHIVHLMILLKIHGLAFGHSGSQWEVLERLMLFFNKRATPQVFEYGSLGASGDLAPLAHLSLPIIGEGFITHNDKKLTAEGFLQKENLKPLKLKAKDGLALLNGTQFMSAYGVWCCIHAKRIIKWANLISALSLDVFDGRIDPFHEEVHRVRNHPGQSSVASEIESILKGSELINEPKTHVQDPYSFRCIPQVHGATTDTINHVLSVIETEINSVTDNPIIFPDKDEIVSAGNFHGQPLALSLDYLSIAISELGNISERRIFQLISGQRNLPYYLVANPGINSGLMIPQYTAAHLVNTNRQLAVPSSTDSIVSSNGQEDHVSMGATSAVKCKKIIENLYSILAIELITATQALEFKRPLKTSPLLENIHNNFRKRVTFIEEDRILHKDIVEAELFLKENQF